MEVFLALGTAEKGAMVLSRQGVCNPIVRVPAEKRGRLFQDSLLLQAGYPMPLGYNPPHPGLHLTR